MAASGAMPTEGGLAAASARGASWLLLATAATSVLQLASAAVLGRLLAPEDFGVVAAAMLLIRVVYYFSQFGLGSALVQRRELSRDDVRAAAWLAVVIGSVATLVGVLTAPILAALLHQPDSARVAQVLSVSFLLTGISTTPLALLRRNLRFRAVAAVDVSSYALGYLVVGLVAVFAGAGVWSLVLAALTQGAVQAAASLVMAPHPVSLRPPAGAMAPLAGFGGKVSVIGMLEFWSLQIDSLGVARGRPAADLGQYTRGTLLSYPVVQASLVITRVLASSFARVGEVARQRQAYRDAQVVLATVVLSAAAVLAAGHDPLVIGLLGRQWSAAAAVLPWLAGASALQAISQLPAVLCEATGVLGHKVWIQIVVLTAFILAVGTAVRAAAPLWTYAACWLGAEGLRVSLYLGLLNRRFGLGIAPMLADLRKAAGPALVVLLTVAGCDRALAAAEAPTWLRLLAVVMAGAVTPPAVIACIPNGSFRRVIRARRLLETIPAGTPGRPLLTRVLA